MIWRIVASRSGVPPKSMPRARSLPVTISFRGAVGVPPIVARLPESRFAMDATS